MSKITRERAAKIAAGGGYNFDEVEELARIALASLEAEESGRNPVLAYADSYRDMAKQGVESIPVWSVITDLERNIAPLYSAPPAPVVPAELHPDTLKLVTDFCSALAEKLYKAQLKYGYDADWKQDGWPSQCQADFQQHIAKGDPRMLPLTVHLCGITAGKLSQRRYRCRTSNIANASTGHLGSGLNMLGVITREMIRQTITSSAHSWRSLQCCANSAPFSKKLDGTPAAPPWLTQASEWLCGSAENQCKISRKTAQIL